MDISAVIFCITVSIILPVVAVAFTSARQRGTLKAALLGGATFFVFQVVIRIPVLQYLLPEFSWYLLFQATNQTLYILMLSFTAGLFEEGGRWIVMMLFLKRRTLPDGIAFGLGHGGIEAILLVGVNAISMLIIYGIPYAEPLPIFLAGVERLAAICSHIAFSLIVLRGVTNNKPILLILAMLLHTLMNFVAVMMMSSGANDVLTELYVVLFAIGVICFSLIFWKRTEAPS